MSRWLEGWSRLWPWSRQWPWSRPWPWSRLWLDLAGWIWLAGLLETMLIVISRVDFHPSGLYRSSFGGWTMLYTSYDSSLVAYVPKGYLICWAFITYAI